MGEECSAGKMEISITCMATYTVDLDCRRRKLLLMITVFENATYPFPQGSLQIWA